MCACGEKEQNKAIYYGTLCADGNPYYVKRKKDLSVPAVVESKQFKDPSDNGALIRQDNPWIKVRSHVKTFRIKIFVVLSVLCI